MIRNNKTFVSSTKKQWYNYHDIGIFIINTLDVKKIPITLIEKHRTLSDNEGIALEIEDDNEKWTILSRAREIVAQVDILKAGNMEGYGMTMIKNLLWKYPESIF